MVGLELPYHKQYRPRLFLKSILWTGEMAQFVKCLLCRCEDMSSNPNTHITVLSKLYVSLNPALGTFWGPAASSLIEVMGPFLKNYMERHPALNSDLHMHTHVYIHMYHIHTNWQDNSVFSSVLFLLHLFSCYFGDSFPISECLEQGEH